MHEISRFSVIQDCAFIAFGDGEVTIPYSQAHMYSEPVSSLRSKSNVGDLLGKDSLKDIVSEKDSLFGSTLTLS